MIAWADGVDGVSLPDWAFKCQVADTFGMRPWEVGDIPYIWILRYAEFVKWRNWRNRRRNA